jgi:hypothetical protein
MGITKLYTGAREGLADGCGAEAELLANDGQRVAVDVEPLRLLGEFRRYLLPLTQPDALVPQMPSDGVTVGPKLASKLVCGHAEAIQLDQLVQLGGIEATGHTVVARGWRPDLRRCWTYGVTRGIVR